MLRVFATALLSLSLNQASLPGVASWYGRESCPPFPRACLTATGESFNENLLTAAVRSDRRDLLYQTVTVENPANGAWVTVRVNDVCPGCPATGRMFDLSRAAMQQLGGIGAGVIRITYYIGSPQLELELPTDENGEVAVPLAE